MILLLIYAKCIQICVDALSVLVFHLKYCSVQTNIHIFENNVVLFIIYQFVFQLILMPLQSRLGLYITIISKLYINIFIMVQMLHIPCA